MTASNGEKFPFALSPGMFVLSDKKAALFTEGKSARSGLEMQAEDGDPIGISRLADGDAPQFQSARRFQYAAWSDVCWSNPPR